MAQSRKIGLNQASREALNRIPGIGGACVDRIVEAREQRGGLKSFDELDQIPGFGAVAIRNLKAHATV